MITRMNFNGPPTGCRKVKTEIQAKQELTLFQKLSKLSLGDLERTARKGRASGAASEGEIRSTAVEVLIKRYNINEVRSAVKDSLKRLSSIKSEAGSQAKDALEKFREAEATKKPSTLGSANVKTFEEFQRENKTKTPSIDSKTQKMKKKKGR